MISTLLGIVTVFRPLPSNEYAPIEKAPFGMVNSRRLTQSANAESPIVYILPFILTLDRFVQSSNALLPILL